MRIRPILLVVVALTFPVAVRGGVALGGPASLVVPPDGTTSASIIQVQSKKKEGRRKEGRRKEKDRGDKCNEVCSGKSNPSKCQLKCLSGGGS